MQCDCTFQNRQVSVSLERYYISFFRCCQIKHSLTDADHKRVRMAAKKKTSLGCLFWLALVLLVAVVFLFNRRAIENVITATDFPRILRRTVQPIEPTVTIDPSESIRQDEQSDDPLDDDANPAAREADQNSRTHGDEARTVEITVSGSQEAGPEDHDASSQQSKPNLRRARLFFVTVDSRGGINLKGVIRPVYYDDSPLKDTVETLLRGLTPSEVNQGLLNMISPNTKLSGVSISGDTAVVSFTEEFRFNPLGVEGLKAQVKQVVYSVTEFSNIDSVQILIDGRRVNYLGPEGVYVGEPLSRQSFRE